MTTCHIRISRRALGSESSHLLRTVRRRGYIFDATALLQQPGPSAEITEIHAFRTGEAAQSRGTTRRGRPSSEMSSRLAVLILPLRSLDGSAAYEFLAESATENLPTGLARYLTSVAPGETRSCSMTTGLHAGRPHRVIARWIMCCGSHGRLRESKETSA